MHEPEISQLIRSLETLSVGLSPKVSLEQAIAFLLVCEREELPMIELAEKMDWTVLKTSRSVNSLAEQRYGNGQYNEGYQVVYTEDDKENRTLKNAFLTHKGKQIKAQLIEILKAKTSKKS